ncbi:MAG TPA: hypothetical protein VF260_04440 [Bacilli bacterium]
MEYVSPNIYMPNVQPIHVHKPMAVEPAHVHHHVNVSAPVAAAPVVCHVPVGFTNTAMVLVLFILLVIILRSRFVV